MERLILAASIAVLGAFGPAFAQTAPAKPDAPAAAEGAVNAAPETPAPDTPAPAADAAGAEPGPIIPASETTLEDWLWLKRPVVVFADSAADPRYVQQLQFISDRLDALVDRDVIVITDTDPGAQSSVRRQLRPRGFMVAIIAKDGTIVTRKPSPWSVREISRSIDKLPMRQQEVRDRRSPLN